MRKEKGSVVVETTLIFPIVLLTVMAMLYFGLFKLQEAAMLQQVQRTAHQGSMLIAYPGYETLGDYATKQVDFGSVNIEDIGAYYRAYHQNFKSLYREIAGYSGWTSKSEIESFSHKLVDSALIFPVSRLLEEKVEIKRSIMGTSLVATLCIKIPTPGVLRYFGIEDEIVLKQSAYAMAIQPSGFMRNVDLAADAVVAASEKLGLKDDLDKIVETLGKVADFLF